MWDAFLREITRLENKEPCEAGPSRVQEKKPTFAVEVEDTKGMTLREKKLTRRITLLEKQLMDQEPKVNKGAKSLEDVRPYDTTVAS